MAEWIEGSPTVPKISDESLNYLNNKFTPLYKSNDKIFKIKSTDNLNTLRNTAFTWSPELMEEVGFCALDSSYFNSECNYYGFYKPSIAEVLSQIPDNIRDDYPGAYFIDMDTVQIYNSGEGHRARVYWGHICKLPVDERFLIDSITL